MSRETELLNHVKLEGDYEGRNSPYLTELLYANQVLSRLEVEAHDAVVEYQREYHRFIVGEKVSEALYRGWLPYDIEWWEGYYDDPWTLKDYRSRGGDDYQFWTRIKLAAPRSSLALVRSPKQDGLSIRQVHPQELR